MAVKWEKVEKNIYRSTDEKNKYRVDLYFGRDSNNKIKKSSKVVYGTLTEARKQLAIHEAGIARGEVKAPVKITIIQLIEEWNRLVGDVKNTETTQTSTKNIQKHIIAYFGENARIDKITVTHIRDYMAYLKTEKGLSAKTVNKHRTHLHTLFAYAICDPDRYSVYRNPVDAIQPFSVEKFDHEIYSPEEAKELLLALLRSERKDLEIAVNLAFWCACRREETCALKWKNVNMKEKVIKICEVRTTAKGKVVERQSTKNKEIRFVGIPDWLYDALTRLSRFQDDMKALYGTDYDDGGYVFCHPDGKPWHPNSLSVAYKAFLEKNGFKVIRYHDLRHTNLSMLMTKMSAVDVAKIGGHKQVSTTTDIYGHSFDDSVERGMETMNTIMNMNEGAED